MSQIIVDMVIVPLVSVNTADLEVRTAQTPAVTTQMRSRDALTSCSQRLPAILPFRQAHQRHQQLRQAHHQLRLPLPQALSRRRDCPEALLLVLLLDQWWERFYLVH